MKRIFCLGLMLTMCFLLTGCFCVDADVNINSDGSGSIIAQVGYNEMTYQMLNSIEESGGTVESSVEMKPFVYNGKTYYGDTETRYFSTVEEFNSQFTEIGGEDINTDGFSLEKNTDGSLTLKLKLTQESNSNVENAEMAVESMEMSEFEKEVLLADMVMLYTFNMPGKVTQISGDTAGITINNNVLEIDFMKLDIPQEPGIERIYTFTTKKNATVESNSNFSDVPESLWSYKAISVLAEGGLVSGVGNNKFSPERGMKISEFCQVLANATGLESGTDANGYWAGKAIKSCIESGYIYTHGEINSENYSDIITREEAIAAMQLASGRPQIKNMTIQDIPDGNQIDLKYRELVLGAYNSGITTGVNDQFKFSPKSQLTRGQVCQLFYNVNWTTVNK